MGMNVLVLAITYGYRCSGISYNILGIDVRVLAITYGNECSGISYDIWVWMFGY